MCLVLSPTTFFRYVDFLLWMSPCSDVGAFLLKVFDV
nr:MAG TPA: hypothetical protein [Caudoviricetes sp.]